MLWTIDVPGLDREEDDTLGFIRIVRVRQAVDEIGVILHDPGRSPDLNSSALDVVDQEDKGLRILGKIPERNVMY